MGPATGLSFPHSLVADGPLEADALLALEQALRVDLGLDRLELRETVRAPGVLLHGDALVFFLGVRQGHGASRGVVGLEGSVRVDKDMVVLLLSRPRGDSGSPSFNVSRGPLRQHLANPTDNPRITSASCLEGSTIPTYICLIAEARLRPRI